MYKFIIPLFALAFLLISCSPTTDPPAGNGDAQSSSSVDGEETPSGPKGVELKAARDAYDGTTLTGKHVVTLKTSKGDIVIELDADAAPKTVTNFVTLAKAGYFDGLAFHRVVPGFVIQGGDPSGNGTGGESVFGPNFEDEINAESYNLHKKKVKEMFTGEIPPELADLSVKQLYERDGYVYDSKLKSLPMARGAIAMANRGANTNGSQFFVVQGKSFPGLEGKHTVFGTVTTGLDIVDAIVNVPRSGTNDMPTTPVTFTVTVK